LSERLLFRIMVTGCGRKYLNRNQKPKTPT
jgi:hypothetical protein